MQRKYLIAYGRYSQNFFILELAILNKIMQINRCKRLINLINKNKKIRV